MEGGWGNQEGVGGGEEGIVGKDGGTWHKLLGNRECLTKAKRGRQAAGKLDPAGSIRGRNPGRGCHRRGFSRANAGFGEGGSVLAGSFR